LAREIAAALAVVEGLHQTTLPPRGLDICIGEDLLAQDWMFDSKC